MPKCFTCNSDLIWQNDFDAEDIYEDSEYNIISMYDCKKCNTWYEVYHDKKEKDGKSVEQNNSEKPL